MTASSLSRAPRVSSQQQVERWLVGAYDSEDGLRGSVGITDLLSRHGGPSHRRRPVRAAPRALVRVVSGALPLLSPAAPDGARAACVHRRCSRAADAIREAKVRAHFWRGRRCVRSVGPKVASNMQRDPHVNSRFLRPEALTAGKLRAFNFLGRLGRARAPSSR